MPLRVRTTLTTVQTFSPAGAIASFGSESYISGSALFTHNSAGDHGGEKVVVVVLLLLRHLSCIDFERRKRFRL